MCLSDVGIEDTDEMGGTWAGLTGHRIVFSLTLSSLDSTDQLGEYATRMIEVLLAAAMMAKRMSVAAQSRQ